MVVVCGGDQMTPLNAEYKDFYARELQRREELNGSIERPMAIITALVGVLYFCLHDLSSQLTLLTGLQIVVGLGAGGLLVAAVVEIVRSNYDHTYGLAPTPKALEDYRLSLTDYHATHCELPADRIEQKVIEHYDLYVRAMADLENARRRSSEELVKTRKFAIEKFAENLLPVVDSLEKALEATAADKDSAAREGMEATYRQLMHALDVSDMKPIDPKGEAFDPHFHMAITMVPAPEGVKPGMVVQVFQRGWNIAGRVLRPLAGPHDGRHDRGRDPGLRAGRRDARPAFDPRHASGRLLPHAGGAVPHRPRPESRPSGPGGVSARKKFSGPAASLL